MSVESQFQSTACSPRWIRDKAPSSIRPVLLSCRKLHLAELATHSPLPRNMLPSNGDRAGPKSAGVKRKAPAARTQRESSVERHRQSYVRAWNAINQAKQDCNVNTGKILKETNDNQRQQRSQPSPCMDQASASADGVGMSDKSANPTKKRKKPLETYQETTKPQGKALNVDKTAQISEVSTVSANPGPFKADEDSSDSDDDDSTQVSSNGLFVTPSAKTIWHDISLQHRPRLIPFPRRKSRRELAIVFGAPDSPKVQGVSKEILKAASRKAFGPKAVRKVHQYSPTGVWLVKLASQPEARDGAGKRLVIGGVGITAEGISKVPSKVFVWKPGESDVVPSKVEIADSLRQTFVWPLPEVNVQEFPMQVSLTFSQCPELLRLYLPLADGTYARLDPVQLA